MRHLVGLQHLGEPRSVGDVAELDVDAVEHVANERFVAPARVHHRTMPLIDEFSGRLGADDAHAARNHDLHFLSANPPGALTGTNVSFAPSQRMMTTALIGTPRWLPSR